MNAENARTITGTVFDIQRYSIHDGPGIRTIVFIKGCPLSCKWCSNPESQAYEPQVFYVKSKCIGCGLCERSCPNNEVKLTEDGLLIDWKAINASKDLSWVNVCPTGALGVKGEKMTAQEVFDIVMRDKVFYDQSGGGLTLSGGEPLVQSEFALELLKMLHDAGVNTAIETTGAVDKKVLLDVLPYTDLFLYDFKHWDNEIHKKYIGASNSHIKENLKMLAEKKANILVRVPVIPGVNDTEKFVSKVISELKEYGIDKLALLPFHQYGSGKYVSCGMTYEMQDFKPPAEDKIEELRKIISDAGFSNK